jgi:fucose 4-O-acetylase-like acetyltransferase
VKDYKLPEIDVAVTIGIMLIVFGHLFVTAAYDQANPLCY